MSFNFDTTRHKKAEEELYSAKQHLEAHISNSPLAIIEFDSSFHVIRWSKEAERMFGWKAKEILGKAINKIRWVYEDDVELVEKESVNLFSGKTPRHMNVNRNYRKDGSVIWCEWYSSAIYDSQGKLVSVFSQILDITERKKAEKKLQESEKRFRLIFETMAEGFTINEMFFDKKGRPYGFRYLEVNPAFEKYTGLKAKDIVGKTTLELFPNIEPLCIEVYGKVAKTGETGHFEAQFGSLNNWFEVIAHRIEKDYVAAIFFDITERKKIDDVSKSSFSFLEAVSKLDVSLEKMLQKILDEIEKQTASKIGFYHFVEPDQKTLSLQQWSTNTIKNMCAATGEGEHYPISEAGIWVECVYKRKPVVHNDYASLPNKKGLPKGHAPVIREALIPIFRQGKVVAIIGVGNKPNDYTKTDIEIISLLGDFSWEIVERKRAEEKLKQRYEAEHNIAETLQKSLVSSYLPKIKGLEFKHIFQSASAGAEVGGDFYDLFRIPGGGYGILMGDVAGKGIDVAAETAKVKYLLRDRAYEESLPGKVLSSVNEALFKQKSTVFTALTYATYYPENSVLTVSNAANPYPYLVNDNRFIRITGVPVSINQNETYFSEEIKMKKGDMLIFYTDGLTEARYEDKFFGAERVRRFVKKNKDLSLNNILKGLVEEARRFSKGNLPDDVLVLGIKKT